MAQEEQYNSRDRSYSAWHRRNSTRRFVGIEKAQTLAMIDLDAALYVEYDDKTKEPLALVEAAIDTGQAFKSAAVTANLARRAGIPAFTVLYRRSGHRNPADANWPDIDRFRVRRVSPEPTDWKIVSPELWAKCLLKIRT